MLRTTGETRRGFTAVQAHTNAMPSRAVVEARKPAGLITSCGSGGRYDTLVASMAIVPLGWSSDRLRWRGSREHVPSVPVAAMAGKRLSIETPKCSGCFPHAHQIFEIVCRRKAGTGRCTPSHQHERPTPSPEAAGLRCRTMSP